MARPLSEQQEIGDAPNLSFKMTPDIAECLGQLQSAVRTSGHAKPSQKTLVEALVFGATKDGEDIETIFLVPYRQAHPAAE